MTSQPQTPGGQESRTPVTCKRPGCPNTLPAPGRGRARQFCSDDCARRYHNDARIPAPAVAGSSSDDPLASLEALARQAAVLIRAARDQAASLDPAHVRAQIAEAEAARRRAEAAAVTADARAAESEAETQALAAALAAEAGLAQLRRETTAQITAIQAEASEQVTAALQETARSARERDNALAAARETAHHAETEVSRARQAETDARDETSRVRDDAARERDALSAHHRAQLAAASTLTAAEQARAQRAEQQLEIERADRRQLTGHITANGTQPPAPRKRTTPAPRT